MAATCAAIDSRALWVNPAGSSARSAGMSSKATPLGRYVSGSWAEVWSVTMLMGALFLSRAGKTSAALPSRPMDRGWFLFFAAAALRMASSMSSACSSR